VPLSEIGGGLERREERKIALAWLRLTQATTDELQGRTQFRLRQLIYQVMQFLTHDAHTYKCRSPTFRASGSSSQSMIRRGDRIRTCVTEQSLQGEEAGSSKHNSLIWRAIIT